MFLSGIADTLSTIRSLRRLRFAFIQDRTITVASWSLACRGLRARRGNCAHDRWHTGANVMNKASRPGKCWRALSAQSKTFCAPALLRFASERLSPRQLANTRYCIPNKEKELHAPTLPADAETSSPPPHSSVALAVLSQPPHPIEIPRAL